MASWLFEILERLLAWIGGLALVAVGISLASGPTWCRGDGCSVQAWFGASSGWVAAAAALATISVLFVTNNISRQALAESKASTERQQRAYVFTSGCMFTRHLADSPSLVLEKKNTGLTPAYKVKTTARWVILPAADQLPDDLPSGEAIFGDVGAGQEKISRFLISEEVVAAHGALIIGGGEVLHLFGQITYEDAFGSAHETHFHYVMPPNLQLVGDLHLALASAGNSST